MEDGVAPIGLWWNCYDANWLKLLPPHVCKSLHLIKADYDFSLPPRKTLLSKACKLAVHVADQAGAANAAS